MSDQIAFDSFAQQLGTLFQVTQPGLPLVVLELREARQRHASAQFEAFTLIFRGPSEVVLPQATYHLAHAVLGSLDLFIVPIARDQAGIAYEAAFNRLHGEGGR